MQSTLICSVLGLQKDGVTVHISFDSAIIF